MSASNATSPLDALASNYDEYKYGPGKNISIIRSSSAIVSVAASALLIWILFKSRNGIKITYHRLLLGLSISDILLSLSFATFGAVAPIELSYAVWNARGSRASCDALGFLNTLGAYSGLLYMCSLSIYFLAKVKFNKTDTYVAKKLEPGFHLVPTLFGSIVSVVVLVKQRTNATISGYCGAAAAYDPPHCDGYEDGDAPEGFEIPCGRGRSAQSFYAFTALITTFLVPITIGSSLFSIYRSVSRAERRIARYGAGALQTNRAQPPTDDAAATDVDGGSGGGRGAFSFRSTLRRLSSGNASSRNSNNRDSSQSRAVLHRAAAYSVSYFVTWIWAILVAFLAVGGTWTTDFPQPSWQIAYRYVLNFFQPLQGMWTFIIYLQPSVVKRKRLSDGNISWFRAFADTLRSAVTGRTISSGRGRNRADTGAPRTAAAPHRTGRNSTPAPGPQGRNASPAPESADPPADRVRAEAVDLEAEDPKEEEKREVREDDLSV